MPGAKLSPVHRSFTLFLRLCLAAVAIVLICAVSALAVFYSSPQRAVDALVSATARFSRYELQLVQPSLAWSPLRFTANLVFLRQSGDAGPPLVALQNPELDMSAWELLSGHITRGQFTARNITYYLDNSSGDSGIDLEALLAPLGRLPMEMHVESLHLISRSENISIFPLLNLSAQRDKNGLIELSAEANVASRPVRLQSQVEWSALDDGSHQLALQSQIYAREEDSELQLTGLVNAAGAALNYQFSLQGRYQRVSDFLKAFDENAYGFSGNMTIDGELRGNLDTYALTVHDLGLSTPDSYSLHATGTVRRDEAGLVTLDLEGRGDARRLDTIIEVPEDLANALGRSELVIGIRGTLAEPVISRAALVFYGPGETRLELSSADQSLDLAALQSLSAEQTFDAQFAAETADLGTFLAALSVELPADLGVSGGLRGTITGSSDDLRITVSDMQMSQTEYQATGEAQLLWRQGLLSAPRLKVNLSERNGVGLLEANGAVADLTQLRGLGLQLSLNKLSIPRTLSAAGVADMPLLKSLSGTGTVQRAADALLLRDLNLTLEPSEGLQLTVSGSARTQGSLHEADLAFELADASDVAWLNVATLANYPRGLKGQLRLRPTWATVISDFTIGQSPIQAVLSADITEGAVSAVAADMYSPKLHIDDFARVEGDVKEQDVDQAFQLSELRSKLPDYPLHLTLRSDNVSGPLSRIENFSLALDVDRGHLLLRELDTRYAGGELTLRGLIDLNAQPPALSLAGQGIRVPLGTLTSDLGLQQSVQGAVSLRGGISTRGLSAEEWRAQLKGRVATALTGVTVSGAAYDLLMSNILAWVVRGAGEKTTTFDCTMAQFDIDRGVANSDSLYIETPRMLATGKASVDLPQGSLDVRIEPRSKTRAFQFPSAVRVRGPLDNPKVSVSELQATADLSAQALLLLPSLTLKLFGIGGDSGVFRPCDPSVS